MAAQCEICGGTNIVKEATGDFVCQDCGAAYSVDAMRIMITGEVIDEDPVTDAPSSGGSTKEEQLEEDVTSNYKLGNYSRAKALLDGYISDKWKEIGRDAPIPLSEIPYAHFLGNLAGQVADFDSGKSSSLSSVPMYLNAFVDNIVESGRGGTECVNAICEMYVIAASVCIDRVHSYIELAQTSAALYEATYNTEYFKKSIDAKFTAQSLLDTNRVAREEAIVGCAYVSALGMDIDDEALSNISGLYDDPDLKSRDIPHVNGAERYLRSIMGTTSSSQRRLVPDDLEDADALVACGKALWKKSNYGISKRVFDIALKTREDDAEARCYRSIFDSLDWVTHSTVIANSHVKDIKDEFGKLVDHIGSSGVDDPIFEMVDAKKLVCKALNEYASYLKKLAKIQLVDDDSAYKDTEKVSGWLSDAVPAISGKILEYASRELASGKAFSREQYAMLKLLGRKSSSTAKIDKAAERALESIKKSFLETQGGAADFSVQEREVADARRALQQANGLLEGKRQERAKLGVFDRKRKKELDDEISAAQEEVDEKGQALKIAQAALDKAKSTRESAWANLR